MTQKLTLPMLSMTSSDVSFIRHNENDSCMHSTYLTDTNVLSCSCCFDYCALEELSKERKGMNSRKKSQNFSIFSWNDRTKRFQMQVCENGRKLNVQLFGRNRHWTFQPLSNEEKTMIKKLKQRTRSLPQNVFSACQERDYLRQLGHSTDIETHKTRFIEGRMKASREESIQRLKAFVAKVLLLRSIFQRMFSYAMEKGCHDKITSDPRMRLKGHQPDLNPDKDILFDPERFKIDFQGFFPKWAENITRKAPGDRTEEDIDSLLKLLRQLKAFRRYTHETQKHLCRAVKYDRTAVPPIPFVAEHFCTRSSKWDMALGRRNLTDVVFLSKFERHRVIIRKGHVGRRFYIIYSGTVCFTLTDDDNEVFSKPTEYYNLYKGDAFGELALLRGRRRAATIVCLQRSEFLSVEKEDFYEMGIFDVLRSEMETRVTSLRNVDLFSTWSSDVLRKVAEESRSLVFRNDVVIDRNLLMTDLVYIIKTGKCHVLRLLDLTKSEKWAKLRRYQKKLYSSVFPGSVSWPCSRQGAYSSLSTFSNTTSGSQEQRITRLLSDPQLPARRIPRSDAPHQRTVKSAFSRTSKNRERKAGTFQKEETTTHQALRMSQIQRFDCGKSACSTAESEESRFGVGVFLRVDALEKEDIAGLHGVLRAEEDTESNSSFDTRHMSLVSKGCTMISLPVEVVKKYADVETIKKIQKKVKTYPTDEELLDFYLEKSNWNAYKDVLLCKTMKEIEERKSVHSTFAAIHVKRNKMIQPANKSRYTLQRPETRNPNVRSHSVASQSQSFRDKDHLKRTRDLRTPSPTDESLKEAHTTDCPQRPNAMIYAQGSHRNLVLVNGRHHTSTIPEEVQEQLGNTVRRR